MNALQKRIEPITLHLVLSCCWDDCVNVAMHSTIYKKMDEIISRSGEGSYRMMKALNDYNVAMIQFVEWYKRVYDTKRLENVSRVTFNEWLSVDGISTMFNTLLLTLPKNFPAFYYKAWDAARKEKLASNLVHIPEAIANADIAGPSAGPSRMVPAPPNKEKVDETKNAQIIEPRSVKSNDKQQEGRNPIARKREAIELEKSDQDSERGMGVTKKRKLSIASEDSITELFDVRFPAPGTSKGQLSFIFDKVDDKITNLRSWDRSGDVQIKLSITNTASLAGIEEEDLWRVANFRSSVICSTENQNVRESIKKMKTMLSQVIREDENVSEYTGDLTDYVLARTYQCE